VLTNVQMSQAGGYSVVVSNALAMATSQTATLTVTGGPPMVVTHPTNQTVASGSSVTFGVNASGSAPLRYQWRRDVTAITDATNSILILTNVQLNQAGNYSVMVSNLFGVATSQTATLTVYRAPSLADYDLSRDFSLAGTRTARGVTVGRTRLAGCSHCWERGKPISRMCPSSSGRSAMSRGFEG
jgi:hypothetical protein